MTDCAALQKQIALYVEGDLQDADCRKLESHLRACASCWDVEAELRESQALFKSLRLGQPNTAALEEVRERVRIQVGDLQPVPVWARWAHQLLFAGLRRKPAIAGAAFAALVTVGLWYANFSRVGTPPLQPATEVAQFQVSGPGVQPSVEKPPAVVTAPQPRMKRTVPKVEEPMEIAALAPSDEREQISQTPMKFLTDDPDIIIYWLPRDKGD